MKGHLSILVLWLLLFTIQDIAGADELRLVNGSRACAGRVEVKHQDRWGTVCDYLWDMTDAGVVCKQLGCGTALSVHQHAYFGAGSGPIWLDNIVCRGTESALWHCLHRGWEVHSCSHGEDAGVTCSGVDELRLADGSSPCAGRVEVKHQDQWGTVCDDGWDMTDAGIVCKQLRCGDAVTAPGKAYFGRGSGPIWLNNVACVGTESDLWRCGNKGWRNNDCGHGQDAGVTCTGVDELRLVNGSIPCAGRVEVKHQDQWGTVCDDGWDMTDARIVCKQLGCGDAVSAPGKAHFGRGSGRIWLNNVACVGTESALWRCGNGGWGESDCSHGEDAGVTCTGVTEKTDSRNTPAPPRRPPTNSGRVTVPVVVCIILGALLCLVLIILGAQVRSARAQRRGSRRHLDPFSEAMYEEIDPNLMREKQEMGSRSEGASPGGSQLDYNNVEEPALNDVHQTSDSRGGRLHSLSSEVVSGMQKETPFPLPGDTDYDDVGHGDSGDSMA